MSRYGILMALDARAGAGAERPRSLEEKWRDSDREEVTRRVSRDER